VTNGPRDLILKVLVELLADSVRVLFFQPEVESSVIFEELSDLIGKQLWIFVHHLRCETDRCGAKLTGRDLPFCNSCVWLFLESGLEARTPKLLLVHLPLQGLLGELYQ
jgi:hypothetical protein